MRKKRSCGEVFIHAAANFRFRSVIHDRSLVDLADPKSEAADDALHELLDVAKNSSKNALSSEATRDLGQWIVDYLDDTAYNPHINSRLLRQMVLSAFPITAREKEYTPENGTILHERDVLISKDGR
jgi:hypothetical protein